MDAIVVKDVLARSWIRKALDDEIDRLRRSLAKELQGSDIHRLRLAEINTCIQVKECIQDEALKSASR